MAQFRNKFSLLLVLFTILTVSVAHAQEKSLSEDARALQFQISDDFNLTSFSGTTFSYKWHTSSDKAKRIGLSINSRYAEHEDITDDGAIDNASSLGVNIAASYTWMNYVNPDNDIKFYYGYGPSVNFGYDHNERTNLEDVTDTQYGIAALGYVGVEWFFHKSMSLHAEYGASLGFRMRKTDGSVDTEDKVIYFGGDGVKLGISVYF